MLRISILVLVLATGCSFAGESNSEQQRLALETADSIYVATVEVPGKRPVYGFRLVTKLENNSSRNACLNRCYADDRSPIYYLRLIEPKDEYGAAYNQGWACVGHDSPIVVAPGQTRLDTLYIQGPHHWYEGTSEPYGLLEGTFRLSYEDRACSLGAEEDFPDSLYVSNTFEVRLPD